MNIQDYADRAAKMKANGNNCCQAVAMALADRTCLTEDQLRLAAAGFGMGMGNMQSACGALVGAVMVVGLQTQGVRSTIFAKDIQENFKKRCGAILCKELKANDPETGKVLCPCDQCVRNAVLAYGDVVDAQIK